MDIAKYKIAFIGWNSFQFLQVKQLASSIPNSIFLLEKRKNNIQKFSQEILTNTEVPILILNQREIENLDGKYDIIIAQTIFNYAYKLKKSKLVMLQYSYAKEPHQFGTWRALADLTLVYGDYAAKKISYFSPVASVGNPRFDLWYKESFHQQSRNKYNHLLDKNKKTILYMPTWGALSSMDLFLEEIVKLSSVYNLFIKVHHNTDFLEKSRIKKINLNSIYLFGANDDSLSILSVVDIVITDYSGAIFDAIFCKKPLLLLDLDEKFILKQTKMDEYSYEFKYRDKLGRRIQNADEININIKYIEDNYKNEVARLDSIRDLLFIMDDNATSRAIKALNSLMNNEIYKNQFQLYLEETMYSFYKKNTLKERIILFFKKINLM